ncbi:MAG: hypothetical protein WB783_06610 [Arenicellales bacterium]
MPLSLLTSKRYVVKTTERMLLWTLLDALTALNLEIHVVPRGGTWSDEIESVF